MKINRKSVFLDREGHLLLRSDVKVVYKFLGVLKNIEKRPKPRINYRL
jgi:hypothetical protein